MTLSINNTTDIKNSLNNCQKNNNNKKLPYWTRKCFKPRVPIEKPEFTLNDIRSKIPEDLFKRPLWRSLYDVFQSFFLIIITGLSTRYFNTISIYISKIFNQNNIEWLELVDSKPSYIISAISQKNIPYILYYNFNINTLIYSITLISLWISYILLQGIWGTGLWVLGHSAGHFSMHSSIVVNNIIGFILHTLLQVPYFSWQHTHHLHHIHTGDIEYDEVHIPEHINEIFPSYKYGYLNNEKYIQEYDIEGIKNNYITQDSINKRIEKNTNTIVKYKWNRFLVELHTILCHYNFFHRLIMFTFNNIFGWFAYLLTNASGRKIHTKNSIPPNHFLPNSPLFPSSISHKVIISTVSILVVILVLIVLLQYISWELVILLYVGPYIVVNYWLVVITYLQHTSTSLPHFSHKSWNFIQGSLSTIDRSYGKFLNWAFYHIQDTHVIHHLFERLPHYNAVEATKILSEYIGPYYVKSIDEEDFLGVHKSLWRTIYDCNFVSEDCHPALEVSWRAYQLYYSDTRSPKMQNEKQQKSYCGFDDGDDGDDDGDNVDNENEIISNTNKSSGTKRDISNEVYWFRSINCPIVGDSYANTS